MNSIVFRIIIDTAVVSILSVSSYPDSPFNLTKNKTDYCAIKCNGEEHTMCKYKHPSPSCQKYTVTYDPVFAQYMMKFHNIFRNDLAGGNLSNQTLPKASNMRQMKWDPELATIAHRWLSQCVVGHDTCRDTENFQVGQNFAVLSKDEITGEVDDFHQAIQKWGMELENAMEEDISSFRGRFTNFSQLIWHSTDRVGCSEVTYTTNGEQIKAIACNYAPKGNVLGNAIYKIGEPCTACPTGTKCGIDEDMANLCAKGDERNYPEDFDLHDNNESSVAPNMCPFLLLTFLMQSSTRLII